MIVATALIHWKELWKIMLTAVIGGTGTVIVFALLLLGISRGRTARKPTVRYGFYTVSGLCAVLILGIAAIGVYTMTQKPSTGKPKPQAAVAGSTRARAVTTVGPQDRVNVGVAAAFGRELGPQGRAGRAGAATLRR
jgi:hypothetical protein